MLGKGEQCCRASRENQLFAKEETCGKLPVENPGARKLRHNSKNMESRVLFICTGNYYRSRFAEAVFNHHAEALGLPWRAFSRGLAIHLVPPEFLLSPHTHEHLASRAIQVRHTAPGRAQLTEEDLTSSEIVIALKDDEHRPMIRKLFPHWEDRIVFWDIADQPEQRPNEGLAATEKMVQRLIAELASRMELERAA
jgi:protein-tyrosine phosphatase